MRGCSSGSSPPPRPRAQVWQKILRLDGPFPYDAVVTEKEVPFYLKQANAFGIPMDMRHTCVQRLGPARPPQTC